MLDMTRCPLRPPSNNLPISGSVNALNRTSPNQAAVKRMPKSILNNPMIYPDQKTLRRGVVQADAGDAEAVYQKYWELLKIGG